MVRHVVSLGILLSVCLFFTSTPAEGVTVYNKSTFTKGMTALSTYNTLYPPPNNYQRTTFPLGMTSIRSQSGAVTLWNTSSSGYFDDHIQTASLGFTFTFFGQSYTQMYVCTDGYISFTHNTAQGLNQTIAASTNLHGFCAPCWDDLEAYNSYGCSAWVGYLVTGGTGNHVMTVEWWNVDHESTNSTGFCYFQVKLYEATGVIEFHYRNISSNMNNSRVSATIGIESPNGAAGVGGPNTGTGNAHQTVNYRFTPSSGPYDDQSTQVMIGFSFTYHGNMYNQAYISTNGFITFTNAGTTDPSNDPIPSTNTPDDYIALFWDDLTVTGNGVVDKIRYATTGTSPNQVFTVEYYGMTRKGQSTSELTGQIKLYETSHRIEFHYDTSTTNNNWVGVDATIGIEDTHGGGGVGGPNTTNTISTVPTVNYRFDPVVKYNLTVSGHPNQPGSPSPGYGSTLHNAGSSITAQANSPASGSTGVRYVCTGWTGTGSVPPSGSGTSVTFTISQTSSITWQWTTEYQVNVTENPSGAGTFTMNPAGPWYPPGTTVSLTANPNIGYLFNSWSGDISSINNPESFAVNGPMNITGNFIGVPYTLTVSGNPAQHGTANPAYGTHSYASGANVTATVTSPVSGPTGERYVCTGWTGTGDVPATGTTTSVNFTVTQSSTITWQWQTEYQLTLTSNPSAGGSVNENPSGPWHVAGTSVTLTANPSTGYQFSAWSGDLTSTNNPESYTMNAPATITADFTPIPITLTVVSAQGAPSPAVGNHTYNYGTTLVLSSNSPYLSGAGVRESCTGWTGTGDVPANGSSGSVQVTLTQDSQITWSWQTEYELTLTENPVGGGTIVPTPGGLWYTSGTVVSVDAQAATGYLFTGWSGGLSGTTNPETVTVTAPVSVTAEFQATGPTLQVSSNHGNPNPPVGVQAYANGDQVTCTVDSPVSGGPGVRYVCTGWTGSGDVPATGTGTSVQVTLTTNSSITWTWKLEYEVTRHAHPPNGGTVTLDTATDWIEAGETVTATAAPAGGYHFVTWSGDVQSADNPVTFELNGPIELDANFIGSTGLGVAAGPANPADSLEYEAATELPMLQAALIAGPGEAVNVSAVTLTVSGASDETTTISAVNLYVDVNGDGAYDPGDEVFQTGLTFPSNNGTATFSKTPPLLVPASGCVYLLATCDLNASVGDDFQIRIDLSGDVSARGASTGTLISPVGLPLVGGVKTAAAAGTPGSLEVHPGASSPASQFVQPGQTDVAVLQLNLRSSSLENTRVSSITFRGSGSGNDAACIAEVRLYVDQNADGMWDAGDTLLGSPGTYDADDGSVTFSGLNEVIASAAASHWLLVYDLSGGASSGTFRALLADEVDVSVTGVSSTASLPVEGTPVSSRSLTIGSASSGLGDFSRFAGGCGGGRRGTWPLLPLLPLALAVAFLLGWRRRSESKA